MQAVLTIRRVIVTALILAAAAPVEAQRLRELARDHAVRNPGVPMYIAPSPGDYTPVTLEELLRRSDAVVRTRLSRIGSFLSENAEFIFTTYRILTPIVLSGRLQPSSRETPGQATMPVLTTWGGDVTVEGVVIRATDQNFEPITDGGEYLLFLMKSRSRKPHEYEAYWGARFEISGDQETLKPLLKQGRDIFKDIADRPLNDVIQRIPR